LISIKFRTRVGKCPVNIFQFLPLRPYPRVEQDKAERGIEKKNSGEKTHGFTAVYFIGC
jgi:hypothetical protein